MLYQIVTVHDKAADAFGRPMFVMSLGQAVRSFQDECNRAADDNDLYKHAADFVLYHVGRFDDSTGGIEVLKPERIAEGANMKRSA